MLHPDNFEVNEAWIAFRLNERPIYTHADGDFNVIALMDAASCFILGMEFVSVASSELPKLAARRLISVGKSQKQQLPKTLYIPEREVADILCAEARRIGIAVKRIPEEQLLEIIGEARQGFKEYTGGGSIQ